MKLESLLKSGKLSLVTRPRRIRIKDKDRNARGRCREMRDTACQITGLQDDAWHSYMAHVAPGSFTAGG